MKLKYNNINNKLKEGKRINTQQHEHEHTFYQRIKNLRNIIFTDE
jgi:hypothetical protein